MSDEPHDSKPARPLSIPPAHYALVSEAPTRRESPDIFAVAERFAAVCHKEGLPIDNGRASTNRPLSEFVVKSGVHRRQLAAVLETVSAETGRTLYVAPSRPLDAPFSQAVLHEKNSVGRVKRKALLKSTPDPLRKPTL